MKKLIFLVSIVLIYVLYNYPIYSEFVSYLIIFIGFSIIILAIAKMRDKPETYEEVEKNQDKLYNEEGIFKYTNDGFYIQRKNKMDFIKWNEIQNINSFSVRLFEGSQTGYEIITKDKVFEINQNNSPGIEKLGLEFEKNLDLKTIESTNLYEYNPNIIRENNGSERRIIYQKK